MTGSRRLTYRIRTGLNLAAWAVALYALPTVTIPLFVAAWIAAGHPGLRRGWWWRPAAPPKRSTTRPRSRAPQRVRP